MKRILFLLVLASFPLGAQWLDHPTPGVPRTPDGMPDLTAPAPRTADGRPDLSGLWSIPSAPYYYNIAADNPGIFQPWAEALYEQRKLDFAKDSMETLCLPFGPVYSTTPFRETKIVQTPGLIVMLYSDLVHRQIFMDGRELEEDPNPSWMGYSVAYWDDDTLVVESNGFNDRTWLDFMGHPHTEQLRLTERYRRRDFGHLNLEMTIEDPGALSKPLSITVDFDLWPDTTMLEFVCDENEKDRSHMDEGTNPEPISVAPDILATYVGLYEYRDFGDAIHSVELSLSDDTLYWDADNTGKEQMLPFSDTDFSVYGFSVQFIRDSGQAVTGFLFKFAEGDLLGERKK